MTPACVAGGWWQATTAVDIAFGIFGGLVLTTVFFIACAFCVYGRWLEFKNDETRGSK